MGEVTQSLGRVLAQEGSFFLNVAGSPKDPWLPWEVAREVGKTFVLQNVIHWVKSIAIDRASAGRSANLSQDLALGHYKPVGSNRFLHGAHEYIFHFTRTGSVPLDRLAIGVPYQDKSNVGRWNRKAGDVRCRGNTWFLPYRTIRRRAIDRPHPASFPPELPEQCLKLHGLARVRLAVDPFLGIGPSALAAAGLGVPFVGFEIDPVYLGVARDRLTEEGVREADAPRGRFRGAGPPGDRSTRSLRPRRTRTSGATPSSASG